MTNVKKRLKTVLVCCFGWMSASAASAQTVHVTVTNIESPKGQILLAVFKDQQGFKDEKPAFRYRFPKTSVNQGILKVTIEVPPGQYGIALVDDVNKNEKLDKNLVGIPREGVGFSNFYLSGMSKPSFSDFDFEVKGASTAVQCKIRNF